MGIKVRTKVSEVRTPERRRSNAREPYQKGENFLMVRVVRKPTARQPAETWALYERGSTTKLLTLGDVSKALS